MGAARYAHRETDDNAVLLQPPASGNLKAPMPAEKYDAQAMIEAFARGDYDHVLRPALPLAKQGDTDAQCMISLLYQCGYGVTQDAVAAETWLRRAAEKDSAVAWNNLGTLYALGLPGMPRDREKALNCYMRAKELGFE